MKKWTRGFRSRPARIICRIIYCWIDSRVDWPRWLASISLQGEISTVSIPNANGIRNNNNLTHMLIVCSRLKRIIMILCLSVWPKRTEDRENNTLFIRRRSHRKAIFPHTGRWEPTYMYYRRTASRCSGLHYFRRIRSGGLRLRRRSLFRGRGRLQAGRSTIITSLNPPPGARWPTQLAKWHEKL